MLRGSDAYQEGGGGGKGSESTHISTATSILDGRMCDKDPRERPGNSGPIFVWSSSLPKEAPN